MSTAGFQIISAPLLCDRTTMHLGGPAIAEVLVGAKVDAEALCEAIASLGGTAVPLGAGSNILASDAGVPYVLLRQTHDAGDIQVRERGDKVELSIPAGMRLPALLAFAARHGFTGLEGLCGIPGTVGGAIFMNAGSYGTEIGNKVTVLQLIAPGCKKKAFFAAAAGFAYRQSRIAPEEPWFFITKATLLLDRGNKKQIRAAMQENYRKKQMTQPVTAWSAGCAFKNPAGGVSAGKLLDEVGFRGKNLGGMEFSTKHANFLINTGKGSFAAAQDLLLQAQETVRAHFGYDLELEVRIWA